MSNRIHLALRISSFCLVLAGYAALASVRGYGLAALSIPLLFFLFMPAGEWLDQHGRAYRVLSNGLLVLIVLAIPFAVRQMGILLSVIALVMFIQCYTLLHEKTEKNYYHLYLMSFFLLLAACVQEPEPVIAFAFALYLVSAVWAFLTLRLHQESESSAPVLAVQWVPLDATGIVLQPKRAPVFTAGLFAVVSLVSVAAIAITVVAFYTIPRPLAGFLSGGQLASNSVFAPERLEEEIRLAATHDNTIAFMALFPREPSGTYAGSEDLYWRTHTLPKYKGGVWESAPLMQHMVPGVKDDSVSYSRRTRRVRPKVARTERKDCQSLIQHITLVREFPLGLPCVDLPLQALREPLDMHWSENNDWSVAPDQAAGADKEYRVESELMQVEAAALARESSDYAKIMDPADFAMLTHSELLPETAALARQIAGGIATVSGKADAISSWMAENNFMYSLTNPEYLRGPNAIDTFIMTGRVGNCQYFSSALALMLRSLGVPCRIVSGYHGAEWDSRLRHFVVRESMAHAWVEVLYPEHGWVRYDPTPFANISRMESLQHMFAGLRIRAKLFWFQYVVMLDHARQQTGLRNLSLKLFGGDTGVSATMPLGVVTVTPWMPGFALAAMLGLVGFVAVVLARKRRRPQVWQPVLSPAQQRATRLFARLKRHLNRQGLEFAPCSATELAAKIEEAGWEGTSEAVQLLAAYDAVRFGLHPLSAAQYAALRASIRRIRPPKRR